ncbi:MAG TPA: glycoside hydrolase family 13 protein [Candidatus Ruminococcus avistercoris]|nr:glycoside hydrolase family 13 protein [Candidatus Ruminococcus avistercoris]
MDLKHYSELESRLNYIHKVRPLLNKSALYSDESEYYQFPCGAGAGDTVTIRFRTKRNNADAVYLISGALRRRMQVAGTKNGFDYYETKVVLGNETLHYFFEIQAGKLTCYYNELGVTRDLNEQYAFGIVPGFTTPDWAKGAVMYQIFVDRFCNGDKSNDVLTGEYAYIGEQVQREACWEAMPKAMDVRSFYGGDLQGVLDKLDYLQDLGVEVLYLNPIFVSPSNHKYDIQDYDYVDPHYGKIVEDEGRLLDEGELDNTKAGRYIRRVTGLANLEASNQLLIELVEKLHERGMKLILDGVFNHCGSFNKWLDRERIYENEYYYQKGAYIEADSPYHTFFKFNNEHAWPYNEFYDGWWGHDTLPKLNYEASPMLENYILYIARKWVSPPYNVDGWRLDVAADLGHSADYNHRFWKKFRKAVKEANPDALILAEHYGDAYSWLQGDEWDTVMNYDAFMEPVSWFLTGMEKHSDEYRPDLLGNGQSFADAMRYNMARFYGPSLYTAMNELDNHDHSRFLTRTNHKVGRVDHLGSEAAAEGVDAAVLRQAVVIQMTWPGAPTLYYGDEAGVCGFTDPDNRRTYPWGYEDKELLAFYKKIIALHKRYDVLRKGSLKQMLYEQDVLAYGRFSMEEQIAVVINSRGEETEVEVPVWELGMDNIRNKIMRQIFQTDSEGYSEERVLHTVIAGILRIRMKPRSAVILHHKE